MNKIIRKNLKHCLRYRKVSEQEAEDAFQDAVVEFLEKGVEDFDNKDFRRRMREIAYNNTRKPRVGSVCTSVTEIHLISGEEQVYDDDKMTLFDTVASSAMSPEEFAIEKNKILVYEKLLRYFHDFTFGRNGAEMIKLWSEGMSQQEVADKMGLSQDAVSLTLKKFNTKILGRAKAMGLGEK